MTRSKISPKLAAPTWAAFRRRCHQLLAIGYQRALPQILSGRDDEPDITDYICRGIREWFAENPRESFGFDVNDDVPRSENERVGKDRQKPDLIFVIAGYHRPEFFVEAKRLHRTKAPAPRYVGKEGMGCFISGSYARKWLEAAMVGYVQSDTLDHWQATLQEKIEADSQALEMDGIEKQTFFPDSFPLEWSSSHRRKEAPSVKLFHILLDCRKDETATTSKNK